MQPPLDTVLHPLLAAMVPVAMAARLLPAATALLDRGASRPLAEEDRLPAQIPSVSHPFALHCRPTADLRRLDFGQCSPPLTGIDPGLYPLRSFVRTDPLHPRFWVSDGLRCRGGPYQRRLVAYVPLNTHMSIL